MVTNTTTYSTAHILDASTHIHFFLKHNFPMSLSTISNDSKSTTWGFRIKWDKNLIVSKKLKKIRIHRLDMGQNDFDKLQCQMHTVDILTSKEECMYLHPLVAVTFSNVVYSKIHNSLSYFEAAKLYIWRYFNETESQVPSKLKRLFSSYKETPHVDESPIKMTTMRINKNFILRRVEWSQYQRTSVRNSRDYFLRGFKRKQPMLQDLPLSVENNKCRCDFLFGLLKADISSETICAFLLTQFGSSMSAFFKGKEITEPMVKRRRMSAPQRSSITDFKVAVVEIEATCKIQRLYKKRFRIREKAAIVLQRRYKERLRFRKEIVLKIEEWWEPRRIEGILSRRNSRTEIDILAEEIREEDLFEFDEYLAESKEDYNQLKNSLDLKKAVQVVIVVVLCTLPSYFKPIRNIRVLHNVIIVLVYTFSHILIVYRLDARFRWIQTIIAFVLLSLIFYEHSYRLILNVLVCMLFRKYWVVGFIISATTLCILDINWYQIALAFHDLYSVVTLQASNRHSYDIMLHKWATNYMICTIVIITMSINGFTCFNTIDD